MDNNIKFFRKKASVSGRVLGDAIGVTPQAVLNYENGRDIKLTTCRKIVNFFKDAGCKDATMDSIFPPEEFQKE